MAMDVNALTLLVEILDAGNQPGREDLQRALDEQLLHEGVADLNAGAFGRRFAS